MKQESWQFKDFSDLIMIGKGALGLTYKAKYNKSKIPVVMKLLPKKNYKTPDMQMQLKRQIQIHSNLKHRFIAQMYGWFQDQNSIYLVLEYCDGVSLFHELKVQNQQPTQEKIKQSMKQLALAVAYLHIRNVMHRDIKLENIVRSFQGLKLIDFGWSVHSITQQRKTFCGTRDYLPPQIIQDKFYDQAVDIYSLGVVFFELLFDTVPYLEQTDKLTIKSILKANLIFPQKRYYLSQDFIKLGKDLVLKMLNPQAKLRITIRQVLNHPLIKNVNVF